MLHFTCFWLPGCGDFALFPTVPWLAWSPRLSKKKPSTELFSKKNHVLLSKFFSFSNMFFIRLFLANARKKNRVSPCLFPHKLPWKVDIVFRSQSRYRICAVDTGTRHKMAPIVFEGCSRYQACFRLFLCVWYCQHWNSYLGRCKNNKEWGKSRFDEIL